MNDERIETKSVGSIFKNLLLNRYRSLSLVFFIIALLLLRYLPPISLFVVAIYLAFIYAKSHKVFMQEFAKLNGFKYEEKGDPNELAGRLFGLGSSRKMSNVISGDYKDYPVKLFNYSYTIGSGKNQRTYSFTVFEIKFKKTEFPHILLQSKRMSRFTPRDYFGKVKDEELPLEDEHRKNFRLFATKGYEIEVFEIFRPEILKNLSEKNSNLSIEFADHNIYIYDDKNFTSTEELHKIYEVAEYLIDSTGPLLDRMYDDFEALHPYYKD